MNLFLAPIHPCVYRERDRDQYSECLKTDYPREVTEAALAHGVRNRVEAADGRSDLFERKRVLMDDWARYLAQGIGCPHQVTSQSSCQSSP